MNAHRQAIRLLCLLAIAGVCAPRAADAGNREPFFLSDLAATSAGAVLAVAHDAGAAWYNPAGLGALLRESVDVSASAFVLRRLAVQDLTRVEGSAGSGTGDLMKTELESVPTSLVATRRLGERVTGAVGLFVPRSTQREATSDLVIGSGDAGTPLQRVHLGLNEDEAEYFLALAVGWDVLDGLRLGAALLTTYHTATFSGSFWAGDGTTDPLRDAMVAEERRARARRGGVQLTVGAQADLGAGWHVGLVVRSPVVHFYRQLSSRTNLVVAGDRVAAGPPVAGAGGAGFSESNFYASEWVFDDATPFEIGLGVAWHFDGGFVAIGGDLRPPHAASDPLARDTTLDWNARVGARFRVGDRVALGGGLFTDRSNRQTPVELGDHQIDYYGVALGVELRSSRLLADRPEEDSLVFATTIGVRYAVGFGEVAGTHVTFDPTGPTARRSPILVDTTVHELALHLGSAVFF